MYVRIHLTENSGFGKSYIRDLFYCVLKVAGRVAFGERISAEPRNWRGQSCPVSGVI